MNPPCTNLFWDLAVAPFSATPLGGFPMQQSALTHLRCRHIHLMLGANLNFLLRLFPALELIEDSWCTAQKSCDGEWRFKWQIINNSGEYEETESCPLLEFGVDSRNSVKYRIPDSEILNEFYFP